MKFDECEFRIGDKVRRITKSKVPEKFGKMGHVYTVSHVVYSSVVRGNMIRLVDLPARFVMIVNFELVSRANSLPDELFEL